MRYRMLGKTGLKVSEIGFGAWGIGGGTGGHAAYGATDDRQSIQALHAALEAGITFYDTSNLYGMGHSEEVIGRAFREKRSQIVVTTKGGMANAAGEQDFSSFHLRQALEQSLNRLQTDYVDLYQLHSPPVEILGQDDLLNFMESIVEEGKARSVGISARSPQEALIAAECHGISTVQVNVNLLDRRAIDSGVISHCAELKVAIIARTPLCFGFLTGRYTPEDVKDPADHRACWPKAQVERWSAAAGLFGEAIHSGGIQTAGQKALRFCLSFPEISVVIPGMLTSAQVAENVRASELGPLTPEELVAVEQVYRDNVFFIGR